MNFLFQIIERILDLQKVVFAISVGAWIESKQSLSKSVIAGIEMIEIDKVPFVKGSSWSRYEGSQLTKLLFLTDFFSILYGKW
ncbi:MAG: hypothetical protein A2W19_14645 [Spirochaetes bacterium RBG_16_49_21]|nr:MAG: hypothetical protein A2W19_14645 [Spirochaetes bacterium RBG_16_49_21]